MSAHCFVYSDFLPTLHFIFDSNKDFILVCFVLTSSGFVFGMVSCRTGVSSVDSTGTPLSDISERLENLRYTSLYLSCVCERERERDFFTLKDYCLLGCDAM